MEHLDKIGYAYIVGDEMDSLRIDGGKPEDYEDHYSRELIDITDLFGYLPHKAPFYSLHIWRPDDDLSKQFEEYPEVTIGDVTDPFYTRIIQIAEKTLFILTDRINAEGCKFVLPEEFDEYCEVAGKVVEFAEARGWKFGKDGNKLSLIARV